MPSLPKLERHDVALLPLRLFLGGTFVFAGLQKLADPAYLDAHAATGVANQMRSAATTSPIGGIVTATAHHAVLFGLLIAIAEVAVGLGTLLGLLGRLAAAGGMALALSFLLVVSWHSRPYYLGPDIVFLLAFSPLAIAGSGPWSLDALIRRRAATVRTAGYGAPALPERRQRLIETGRAAAGLAVLGLLGGGATAIIGRLLHHDGAPGPVTLSAGTTTPGRASTTSGPATSSPTTAGSGSTSTAPTTGAPPAGTALGRADQVPVGSSARFVDPATGQRAILVQAKAGEFTACSAVCTHAGCTVGYDTGSGLLHCPCHGAEFRLDGTVVRGPARRNLTPIPVQVGSDGTLYVDAPAAH